MRILLSIILSLLLFNRVSAVPNVHSAPIPTWLYTTHPDLNKKPVQRDISNGFYYQLLEEQTSLLSNAEYTHYIKHIINGSGVQNASEVSVTFSPQFQQVIFHRITILREGAVLNQLQLSQIKVVQEETNADEFEYNGLKRAFITLKDIRKDDQIEVSYSLVGFNPVFGNKYSEESFFNSKTAICNYYKAIITTPARKLNIQFRNNAPQPAELHQGNTLVQFCRLGGIVAELYVEFAGGGGDNGFIIITDGGFTVEKRLFRIFIPKYRIKAHQRVRNFYLVVFTYVFEGNKGPFEAIVFKFICICLFLDHFDLAELQLVEDGAFTQDGDAMEDNLLELG